MQINAWRTWWVSFVGRPGWGESVVKALRCLNLPWTVVRLLVLLINRRGDVFTAVVVTLLLPVWEFLAEPHVSAPGTCALPFPTVPSLLFPVQDAHPLPFSWLVPLPLEGPPFGLLSIFLASVSAVAKYSVVQLKGARAASSSDVLLDVTEVVMRSHFWSRQTGWWQPARRLAGGLPAVPWNKQFPQTNVWFTLEKYWIPTSITYQRLKLSTSNKCAVFAPWTLVSLMLNLVLNGNQPVITCVGFIKKF